MSKSTYTASREETFQIGTAFEDFVVQTLQTQRNFALHVYRTPYEQFEVGESEEGYEIKHDRRCTTTGHISVEYYKRRSSDGRWGLSTTWRPHLNTHSLIIGDEKLFFVLSKTKLHDAIKYQQLETYEMPTIGLARRFVPFDFAAELADDVFIFDEQYRYLEKPAHDYTRPNVPFTAPLPLFFRE